MRLDTLVASVVLVGVVLGCKGSDDDTEPARVPKAVTFEGRVDPALVGTWTSIDRSSVLALDKSGQVGIDATSTSAKGRSTSHLQGRWLVSGENLLFQYPEKSGGTTTLTYAAKRMGDSLVLTHGNLKTTYSRK